MRWLERFYERLTTGRNSSTVNSIGWKLDANALVCMAIFSYTILYWQCIPRQSKTLKLIFITSVIEIRTIQKHKSLMLSLFRHMVRMQYKEITLLLEFHKMPKLQFNCRV